MRLQSPRSSVALANRAAGISSSHLPLKISGSLHEHEPKQANNELAIVSMCLDRGIVSPSGNQHCQSGGLHAVAFATNAALVDSWRTEGHSVHYGDICEFAVDLTRFDRLSRCDEHQGPGLANVRMKPLNNWQVSQTIG